LQAITEGCILGVSVLVDVLEILADLVGGIVLEVDPEDVLVLDTVPVLEDVAVEVVLLLINADAELVLEIVAVLDVEVDGDPDLVSVRVLVAIGDFVDVRELVAVLVPDVELVPVLVPEGDLVDEVDRVEVLELDEDIVLDLDAVDVLEDDPVLDAVVVRIGVAVGFAVKETFADVVDDLEELLVPETVNDGLEDFVVRTDLEESAELVEVLEEEEETEEDLVEDDDFDITALFVDVRVIVGDLLFVADLVELLEGVGCLVEIAEDEEVLELNGVLL
jgi:hypothetical protein